MHLGRRKKQQVIWYIWSEICTKTHLPICFEISDQLRPSLSTRVFSRWRSSTVYFCPFETAKGSRVCFIAIPMFIYSRKSPLDIASKKPRSFFNLQQQAFRLTIHPRPKWSGINPSCSYILFQVANRLPSSNSFFFLFSATLIRIKLAFFVQLNQ